MSSLVIPAREKNTLLGLLIATSWPASSNTCFGSAIRAAPAQDLGQVVADRLLELLVGTRAGLAVRPPPDELGGVPEPRAFHMVVADLEHPLGSQRDERQVLVRVPPARHGRPRRALPGLLRRPVPRVPLKLGDQRLQLREQRDPLLHRERADHAHAREAAIN